MENRILSPFPRPSFADFNDTQEDLAPSSFLSIDWTSAFAPFNLGKDDVLVGWSSGKNIPVKLQIETKLDRNYVAEGGKLGWICEWLCPATKMRGLAGRMDDASGELKGQIPGDGLRDEIRVVPRMVVIKNGKGERTVLAKRKGEVLAECSKKIILEGNGSEFPITISDFSKSGRDELPPGALWHLEMAPAPIPSAVFGLSTCRLWLNETHPLWDKNAADGKGGFKTKETAAMVRYEVCKALVESALRGKDSAWFKDRIDNDMPTLGDVWTQLLRSVYSGMQPEDLPAKQKELELRPDHFASRLQAAFLKIEKSVTK